MKTRVSAFLLLLAMVQPSLADDVWSFGMGKDSCATWLTSTQSVNQGTIWILGAWTGMNLANRNGLVGKGTDGPGIVAAVRRRCQNDLSALLVVTVNDVYMQFEKAGPITTS